MAAYELVFRKQSERRDLRIFRVVLVFEINIFEWNRKRCGGGEEEEVKGKRVKKKSEPGRIR